MVTAAVVSAVGENAEFTKKFNLSPWVSDLLIDQSHEYTRTHAPLVQWMLNQDGVFTLSEGEGFSALGLEPGGVVGESVYDVYADVPQILENVRRTLRGEVVIDNELTQLLAADSTALIVQSPSNGEKAWPQKDVVDYILGQAGKHLDPQIVETWLKVFEIQKHVFQTS